MTTTTEPPIDLMGLANEFSTACRRLSDEANPGDVYFLGDLASAEGETLIFDLNKRSTELCLDMAIALMVGTFGFPASVDSRISGTRALDGELDVARTSLRRAIEFGANNAGRDHPVGRLGLLSAS